MRDWQYILTGDGSKTIIDAKTGITYHSRNGAVQESRHVFLESGLKYFLNRTGRDGASILEIGFGTGLNFLLSAEYCLQNKIRLQYTGIEAHPFPADLIRQSDYYRYVSRAIWDSFNLSYGQSFRQEITIASFIQLRIIQQELLAFESARSFDIVYFDAFAAVHQPEMWTIQSLDHISRFLQPGGVFVTYAMNGNLRRNMTALGFRLEKVPGAPGKREMLRAIKNGNLY
jgi:tRNA U34 5-methylaminomethyl-2-thiouridine-forming methyltransferase MnmC